MFESISNIKPLKNELALRLKPNRKQASKLLHESWTKNSRFCQLFLGKNTFKMPKTKPVTKAIIKLFSANIPIASELLKSVSNSPYTSKPTVKPAVTDKNVVLN